jgi:hypothetical protein
LNQGGKQKDEDLQQQQKKSINLSMGSCEMYQIIYFTNNAYRNPFPPPPPTPIESKIHSTKVKQTSCQHKYKHKRKEEDLSK